MTLYTCFEWIHDDVFLADMNSRHADMVCERHFETRHGEWIRRKNRKQQQQKKTLNVIVLHGIFLVTCANEDTIWSPLSFFLFFFKKGGPYISKKPIGGWRFFVCANKISRCSLFIASRLQTALSSPRALHLLSSPLNGITNQRIYFTVATKRRGKKKWAQWSLYHMCVFV